MATALFLEPAPAVPVPAQVGGEARNDHDVANTRFDPGITAWADVCLAGLVRLNGMHGCIVEHHPKNPHATKASVTAANTTTSAMSVADGF